MRVALIKNLLVTVNLNLCLDWFLSDAGPLNVFVEVTAFLLVRPNIMNHVLQLLDAAFVQFFEVIGNHGFHQDIVFLECFPLAFGVFHHIKCGLVVKKGLSVREKHLLIVA